MSDKLSSITGKQNDFATRFMGGGTVASGVSGDVTLTPPSGQRVRLTHLSTVQGVVRVDVTVLFGSTTVVSSANIAPPTTPFTSDLLSVGSYQDYQAGLPPAKNYLYWTGATDEELIITTTNSTGILYYGYEFGE